MRRLAALAREAVRHESCGARLPAMAFRPSEFLIEWVGPKEVVSLLKRIARAFRAPSAREVLLFCLSQYCPINPGIESIG